MRSAAIIALMAVAALAVSTVLIARAYRRDKANFQMALDAVDRMLGRVGSIKLRDVPRVEEARRDLLEDALGLYERLMEEHAEDPRLRLEVAKTCISLAGVCRGLGQQEKAENSFRRAIELLEELAAEFPDQSGYQGLMVNVAVGQCLLKLL